MNALNIFYRYTQVCRSASFRHGLPEPLDRDSESRTQGCVRSYRPWHWIPTSRRVWRELCITMSARALER